MRENHNILVIDDDKGIRETYQEIFTPRVESDVLLKGKALFDEGPEDTRKEKKEPCIPYQVALAENGQSGVNSVQKAVDNQTPYAVAFIDMKMPGMDGAQTSKEIWKIAPDMKIVIVTAYSEYSPEDIIHITGRDDIFYLRKPFNYEEILQFARALTNEWNLERKREALELELKEVNQNLEKQVKKQAAMIVQSEKMATVGILAAGVAHEINNPIAFINSNLSAVKKYQTKILLLNKEYENLACFLSQSDLPGSREMIEQLNNFKSEHKIDFIMEDMETIAVESLEGIDRVKNIVQDLKNFSHIDEAEFKYVDINSTIETTLKILNNEIKYKAAVEKNWGNLPQIKCFPQKISQVFMNLLINAGQAIETKGAIGISTKVVAKGRRDSDQYVQIKIADNGCGIPEENLTKLFDPFFTTKPVGTGTGLGLSIVYEIIEAHNGRITVSSKPGKGTCFTILLPVAARAPIL